MCIFETCFNRGVAPNLWVKYSINPIPKDLSKCIFAPLNYREISLLCTISKVYSSILSVRINNYCDIRNIFIEEQNGFRQNRSCIDHIVLLSDSEKGLQSMLTYLNKWCIQWCLDINVLKSNIIHFTHKKVPISQFVFKYSTHAIKTIDRYTYLGVILDEHMTFYFCIDSR